MIDSNRNELFSALMELSRHYPQWRTGQLISNVAGWADVDVWDVDDSQLLAAIQTHLKSIRDRSGDGTAPLVVSVR